MAKTLLITALWLVGSLFTVNLAATITYHHFDALGSPVASTDEAGNVTWREAYQPFGTRLRKENNANTLWYTGKPTEAFYRVSYFGARWYNPEMGRFMAMDPVGVQEGNIHSFNRYTYGNNNPYRFIDPDGRSALLAGNMRGLTLDQAATAGVPGQTALTIAGHAADVVTDVINPVKGIGKFTIKKAGAGVLKGGSGVTKGAGKKADDVIQVTKDGVALPAKPKYKIPENYVQNPHRSGSYGEVVNGKFKERLRIDPPTQPGKKGPNYSHYHKNGKGTHYSPRSGDPNPGF